MNVASERIRKIAVGVLTTVFVALAIAPAMAQDNRSSEQRAEQDSEQPVGDAWITAKVKTELAAAEDAPAMAIDVDTVNGTVTLSGTVDSQTEADRAKAVAQKVQGVRGVDATGLKVRGQGGDR